MTHGEIGTRLLFLYCSQQQMAERREVLTKQEGNIRGSNRSQRPHPSYTQGLFFQEQGETLRDILLETMRFYTVRRIILQTQPTAENAIEELLEEPYAGRAVIVQPIRPRQINSLREAKVLSHPFLDQGEEMLPAIRSARICRPIRRLRAACRATCHTGKRTRSTLKPIYHIRNHFIMVTR